MAAKSGEADAQESHLVVNEEFKGLTEKNLAFFNALKKDCDQAVNRLKAIIKQQASKVLADRRFLGIHSDCCNIDNDYGFEKFVSTVLNAKETFIDNRPVQTLIPDLIDAAESYRAVKTLYDIVNEEQTILDPAGKMKQIADECAKESKTYKVLTASSDWKIRTFLTAVQYNLQLFFNSLDADKPTPKNAYISLSMMFQSPKEVLRKRIQPKLKEYEQVKQDLPRCHPSPNLTRF